MFVIPMAGLSSRFFKAGYTVPKYQLPMGDAPVFDWALRSFESYFESDLFVIIVRDVYDTVDFVKDRLNTLGIKQFKIHVLDQETQGQAHTVALGIDDADISDHEPVYIFNIDTFRYGFKKPDFVDEVDGYLEVFEGDGDHWSFIALDQNDRVIQTTEKQRISNLCSDGLYFFRSKQLYQQVFEQAQQHSLTVNQEYYIAPMYNLLIKQHASIGYFKITLDQIDFCGTPHEYQYLLTHGLKQHTP